MHSHGSSDEGRRDSRRVRCCASHITRKIKGSTKSLSGSLYRRPASTSTPKTGMSGRAFAQADTLGTQKCARSALSIAGQFDLCNLAMSKDGSPVRNTYDVGYTVVHAIDGLSDVYTVGS